MATQLCQTTTSYIYLIRIDREWPSISEWIVRAATAEMRIEKLKESKQVAIPARLCACIAELQHTQQTFQQPAH